MDLIRFSNYENIYAVDCFQDEFLKVTKRNDRYRKWLLRKLNDLETKGRLAVLLRDFEKLRGTKPDLYAIRYPKSKLNTRVIYVYYDGDYVILLAAFNEKSTSDYDRALEKAVGRYKMLEQEVN